MSHGLCPFWLGYFLVSPLRRLVQSPEKMLAPFVARGMAVLEIGPGMGFFSLPLAGMVGPEGRVVCVDVQQEMLRSLRKRALKAGLADRILVRLCVPASLGLDDLAGKIDFAFAYAVVHEVSDAARMFAEVAAALKPEGRCLVAEPRLHVSAREFERTVATAAGQGLLPVDRPKVGLSRAALMVRG